MEIEQELTDKEVRTFIWGSCVSRDTFEFLPDEYTLAQYIARQSLISAGTEVPPRHRSVLEKPDSAFQSRMVNGDLDGNLYSELREGAPEIDLVLIDLVDERGGVIDFGNAFATKLNEFWRAGGQNASRGRPQISFGSDDHFALWKVGARRLTDVLSNGGLLNRAVVIQTPWADKYDNGDELEIPHWMTHPNDANKAYERYFRFLKELGLYVISLPDELASTSRGHQWGPSPFHYQHTAYEHLATAICNRATRVQPQLTTETPLIASRRDTKQWGQFANVETFEGLNGVDPQTRNVTLWRNGFPVDFQVEYVGAPTTLVSFHAALSREKQVPPIFTGRAVSDGIGVNRIFISDPGLLASDDLGLAWYLGTSELDLTNILAEAIRILGNKMNTKHFVFFGMSGGGFAALNIGHEFPGSLAMPVNPQTSIIHYAEVHWDRMARACFGTNSVSESRERLEFHPRSDQRRLYAQGFANQVVYVQNSTDAHVSTHLIPWFDSIQWDGKASLMFGNWGKGHVPPPGPVLKDLLQQVAQADGNWEAFNERVGAVLPDREYIRNVTRR